MECCLGCLGFLLPETHRPEQPSTPPSARASALRHHSKGPRRASSRAYVDAFSKMHQGMALNFTCNANVDFVHGMIAHHEGEVAMCAALLGSEGGSAIDAELRALCANISTAQTREVEWMEAWLAAKGLPSHASGHNHWCDHQPPPRCAAPTSLIVALVLFALFQAAIVYVLVRSDRRKGSATKEAADVPLR